METIMQILSLFALIPIYAVVVALWLSPLLVLGLCIGIWGVSTFYTARGILSPIKSDILILEDDITLKAIWCHLIETQFPRTAVHWVTSVSAAREKVSEITEMKGRSVNLVIADIELDGSESGLDFLNSAASDDIGKAIVVSNTPERARRDPRHPWRQVIQKPIGSETFVRMLKRELQDVSFG